MRWLSAGFLAHAAPIYSVAKTEWDGKLLETKLENLIQGERWQPVEGFSGYAVSSFGRVRSFQNNRWGTRDEAIILTHWTEKQGYHRVGLRRDDGKGVKCWVHRLVAKAFLGLPDDLQVDHRDGNRKNNNANNLRIATPSQNAINKGSMNGSSRFKGVSWIRRRQLWYACIRHNGRSIALGCFEIEEDAARTYDAAAFDFYGDFARLNFPTQK